MEKDNKQTQVEGTDVPDKSISLIQIDKTAYTIIKEGKAEVLFPNSHDVFYNPVQEFNRDISVALIREFLKSNYKAETGVRILEALAASGLRSIRYALEIPGVQQIVANDLSFQAVESIKRNVLHNHVDSLVESSQCDAALKMYMHRKYNEQFDVIDVDPYGSPTQFLDSAVQSVKDDGLLCITSTDLAVLCGNSSETCHAKYGAVSLRNKCCHEMALRIVLQCVESHANRYGRYVTPLLSLSVDFYLRIFVKINTSQRQVKQSASKLSLVYQCKGCESLTLQPISTCKREENSNNFKFMPGSGPTVDSRCKHCNHAHHLGGPIWTAPIHDVQFVAQLLDSIDHSMDDFNTSKRIQGILHVVLEELHDVPLYYSLDRLSATVHTCSPGMLKFRSALLNAGYRVSLSHACKTAIKTDAPMDFIWDIMRAWEKDHPVKRTLQENSVAKVILGKAPESTVSFAEHEEANPSSRQQKLLRFQVNPEKFWGPKMRAKSSLRQGQQEEKMMKFQGKRKRNQGLTSEELKMFPCKRFQRGKCDYGSKCKYSHDPVQGSEVISETKEQTSVTSQMPP